MARHIKAGRAWEAGISGDMARGSMSDGPSLLSKKKKKIIRRRAPRARASLTRVAVKLDGRVAQQAGTVRGSDMRHYWRYGRRRAGGKRGHVLAISCLFCRSPVAPYKPYRTWRGTGSGHKAALANAANKRRAWLFGRRRGVLSWRGKNEKKKGLENMSATLAERNHHL